MILVTGSSGVLGRALALELAKGSEPFNLLTSGDVNLLDQDTTTACFRARKPRIVYHLAGRVHGLMGNRRYPAEMYVENIRINTNVIEAARLAGCAKIVAVSTVAVYNSGLPMPVKETSIWDGPPHSSEAAYAHAKRAMLAQLEASSTQYGLAFAYPIMTNIYGPHDRFDPENGHVVPSLITKFYHAARTNTAIQVWGTGVAERDFIMSHDAARALIMIGERFTGPINVATGQTVRIRDLVERLQAHTQVDRVEWDATKPDGQILRRYDVSKLQGLGFAPEFTLVEGVKYTYDWYAGAYPNVRM
jgi:GDP-L-fucose synthase